MVLAGVEDFKNLLGKKYFRGRYFAESDAAYKPGFVFFKMRYAFGAVLTLTLAQHPSRSILLEGLRVDAAIHRYAALYLSLDLALIAYFQ